MANVSEVFDIKITLDSTDKNKQDKFNKLIEEIKQGDQMSYNLIDAENCANGRWSYEGNLEGYFKENWDEDLKNKFLDVLDIGDTFTIEYSETECGNCFAGLGYSTFEKTSYDNFNTSHDYENVDWNWKSIYEELNTTPEYAVGFFNDVYGLRDGEVDEFLEDNGDKLIHYKYKYGHCDMKTIKDIDEIIFYRQRFNGKDGILHGY